METHLVTLNATLSSIASLHAAMEASSRKPTPFTNAMLNTYALDVLEYIRDADQLDAALFCYPPLPTETIPAQTSVAAATSSSAATSTSASAAAVAQYEDSLLPRVPEQRQFLPPTPLRKPASEEDPYDSRTLLLAALKLVENYHRAPRARRHIKDLLKLASDTNRESHRFKAEIAAAERDIARYTAAAAGAAPAEAPVASTSHASAAATSEKDTKVLQRLKEEEGREEMEIMALEEMERELKERRATARRSAASRAPAPPAQPEPQEEDATMDAAEDGTIAAAPSGEAEDDATVRAESPAAAEEAEDPADEAASDEPEGSDELERVCENIWLAQGDYLRVLAPDRETGTFRETLALLRALTQGQGAAGPAAAGDVSMASAATGTTGASVATGASSASLPAPLPVATPTVLTIHAAYALLSMLRSPAPHTRELSALRTEADVWWREVGRDAFTHNGGTGDDVNENGEALTFRAVYRLTAQKVLRIKHSGGGRQVSFA